MSIESDAFLQALADDFEAHGKGVVEKVRTERPQDYLKISHWRYAEANGSRGC